VKLTEDGVTALILGIEVRDTVGQLTPDMLMSGKWNDVKFVAYDVQADADVEGRKEDVFVGWGSRR